MVTGPVLQDNTLKNVNERRRGRHWTENLNSKESCVSLVWLVFLEKKKFSMFVQVKGKKTVYKE